jgi:hypothetical protein
MQAMPVDVRPSSAYRRIIPANVRSAVRARDFVLPCILAATAACGGNDTDNRGPAALVASELDRPAVSAEQARAAQLLSLAGGAPATERADYAGMLECAASLGLFMANVENSPLIDDAQIDALKRANDLFRTRALEAGAAEGKNQRQVSVDLERATEEARDDSAASSRTAIGCVRGLVNESQKAGSGA